MLQQRKEYAESLKEKEQEEPGAAENLEFEDSELPFDEEPEL